MSDFSQMNAAQLRAALGEYNRSQTQTQNLPPLVRPRELDDPNTSRELRAQVLAHYTGALLDRPQNTWTPEDRLLMREQICAVLKGMGQ